MMPDVYGYNLEDGIGILTQSGFTKENISVSEYLSPKGDKIGSDIRIVRVDIDGDKVTLTVSYF